MTDACRKLTQWLPQNISPVKYASVATGSSTFFSTNKETTATTYFRAQVVIPENNISNADLARQLAEIVFETYPDSKGKDVL